MISYCHQTHFICECGKRKHQGDHVCEDCWKAATEEIRRVVGKVEPGDRRHIAAVNVLLNLARERHEHVGEFLWCGRCFHALIKGEWRSGYFPKLPGWTVIKTLCPTCSADQITTDA